VKDASWPKTAIDRFILAGLEAKGLKPAPPACKRTLIRRATFDLTGLPPTPAEIDAFLDDDSPDALARVVERLLASPQYGERWGRHWLDLVRYADSRDTRDLGTPTDITEAYRYRDWVVSAFNRDLPYDRFIIDQIAGDLVPAPKPGDFNVDGLVATGLLTIGEWGTGDADKEKMITDIVDDQIDVVGRAFLGLTLACARCHDHKFDPIPTADYYGLAGIFFSTHILPEPGIKTGGSPLLRTPLVPQATVDAANRHKARVAELEKEIKASADKHYAAFAQSLLPETSRYMVAAWEYRNPPGGKVPAALAEFAAERGLHAFALRQWLGYLGLSDSRLLSRPVRDVMGKLGVHSWKGEADCPSLTINTNDQEVALLTFKLPPRSVAMHPGPSSGVGVEWKSPITGTVKVEGRVSDADPAGGDGVAWAINRKVPGALPLASGEIANGASQRFEQGNGADRLQAIAIKAGDRIQLVVLPKANHTCDTTTVELVISNDDGSAVWDLTRDLLLNPLLGNPHPDRLGNTEVWQALDLDDGGSARPGGVDADSPLSAWDRAVQAVAAGTSDRLAIEEAARATQQAIDATGDDGPGAALRKELNSARGPFWVNARDDAKYLAPEARAALAKLRSDLEGLKQHTPPPFPVALAAQEGGVPKSAYEGCGDARIHIRGSYQRLADKVPRHFPRILAGDDQPPITRGSGRLELVRWIARGEHPLTARVMVNRIWQYHFGEGLVRTPSNFGRLGTAPTHPELLDWLAREFVASGWSIKAMHRAIMLSAAYQQTSTTTPDALRADPENRLFGRMNRRRLESEALRDSLLAVSGRLNLAMGGASIRELSNNRRTLYLMTIRSDRSSFGPLFDAADSTAIVDRRTISTVAPQALFLLNDPFALEQARALAERVGKWDVLDDRSRIERLYQLLYARLPSGEESSIGIEALAAERGHGEDQFRSWLAYCQILLCANEFLFID